MLIADNKNNAKNNMFSDVKKLFFHELLKLGVKRLSMNAKPKQIGCKRGKIKNNPINR